MLAHFNGHKIVRNPLWKPHYYQKEAVEAVEEFEFIGGNNSSIVVIPTGGGKCFAPGTPILMGDASIKTVETIKVGDCLVGPDSKPRVVTSLAHGVDMMYRVTPTKGDPYVVNEDHILSLRLTSSGEASIAGDGKRYGDGDTAKITVRDYLKSNVTFIHRAKGWRCGVSEWPQNPRASKPIPPYILGVWLGDGSSSCAAITTADKEVEDAWEKFALSYGDIRMRRYYQEGNRAVTIYASSPKGNRDGCFGLGPSNPIMDHLYELGVIKNKHIPQRYLSASRIQRMELLAGLIDTDGCSDKSGFDYISKLPRLASDVALLCRSLGFSAYISHCIKRSQNGTAGTYYRVSINGDCDSVPVRIKRKRPHARKQIKNVLWHGIKVEAVGIGEYFGFELDGPDGQFLLGDFTVVHNTKVTGELSARCIERGSKSLFLAHAKELVTQPRVAFEDDFGCPATIEMAAMKADESPMVFGSVLTMVNRIKSGKFRPDEYKRVIVDESHRSLSASHKEVIEFFANGGAQVTGCTATPRRGDKKDLLQFYDGIAYDKPIQDLFREGYLIEPTIVLAPLGITVKQEKRSDMTDAEVGEAIEPYLDEAADHVAKRARGRCGLSFLPLRKTARAFRDRLLERGINAEYVGGDIEPEERDAIKFALEMGKIDHVCNAQIWGEGVDIRPVNLIVDLRPTLSWTAAMQKWGRGTRTFDPAAPYARRLKGTRWGKKVDCLIMDFVFETERHSMVQRPAVMVGRDDEEVKAITEAINKGGGGNLMEALKVANNEREAKLKQRLEAMRHRQGQEISAMEFFAGQKRMDLVDYEPSAKWETEPLTDKQREILGKNKFDLDSVQGKGHASKIIDVLMDRSKKNLCTLNQARFIESLLKDNPSYTISVASPYDMGFEQATNWLNMHVARKPYQYKR